MAPIHILTENCICARTHTYTHTNWVKVEGSTNPNPDAIKTHFFQAIKILTKHRHKRVSLYMSFTKYLTLGTQYVNITATAENTSPTIRQELRARNPTLRQANSAEQASYHAANM